MQFRPRGNVPQGHVSRQCPAGMVPEVGRRGVEATPGIFSPADVAAADLAAANLSPAGVSRESFRFETFPGRRKPRSGRLGQIYRGGTAVGLLLYLKREFLPLVQRAHSSFLDCADVDKDIFAPCLWADEAVAFGCIEPFYGACGHRLLAFPVAGGPFGTSSQTTLLHRGATANRDALPWEHSRRYSGSRDMPPGGRYPVIGQTATRHAVNLCAASCLGGNRARAIVPGGHVAGGNVPGGNVPGGNVPGGNMPGGNMPGGR
jgi:hypothetical protein